MRHRCGIAKFSLHLEMNCHRCYTVLQLRAQELIKIFYSPSIIQYIFKYKENMFEVFSNILDRNL